LNPTLHKLGKAPTSVAATFSETCKESCATTNLIKKYLALSTEGKHPVFLGYKNCEVKEKTPANSSCHTSWTPGIAVGKTRKLTSDMNQIKEMNRMMEKLSPFKASMDDSFCCIQLGLLVFLGPSSLGSIFRLNRTAK